MTPTVRVRRASADESLDPVAALQAESFYRPWSIDAIRQELRESPVARLYLLETVEGGLLGFCACWVVAGELHINSLAIAHTVRRRGYARTLLQAIFEEVIPEGVHTATLEVRRSNTPALGLYAGLGFTLEGVRRDYYEQPREDALVLWNRALNGSACPDPR